jgi:hypothetical protein
VIIGFHIIVVGLLNSSLFNYNSFVVIGDQLMVVIGLIDNIFK